MSVHALAGKPVPVDSLIDPAKLDRAYYEMRPDLGNPTQLVAFGTSGHRGLATDGSFTEQHVLAITQAICEYRKAQGISGPLFLGKDTHALSDAAQRTAIEVLAANDIATRVQAGGGPTPTPVISRAILRYNSGRNEGLSDGIVISPSHNPPSDGGFKYNPTHGGPADTDATSWIQNRANDLLRSDNIGVRRVPYERASSAPIVEQHDYITPYVDDLALAIDLDAIKGAGLKLGVDPLGGASLPYWEPIAAKYGLNLEVVNKIIDPRFGFMTLDHDGKIRMDCSSPYAMAGLIALKDRFDVAFGNDPDSDRHGIVDRVGGLLNPNHYLAVAIQFLLQHRTEWNKESAVGKTLVSSSLIDRVVNSLGRRLAEVPVGFKWFAHQLLDGSYCFGGEESAGASFLDRGGRVWTTDKDGILLNLLAAEIAARTGKVPGEHYQEMTRTFGTPFYSRNDVASTPEEKKRLSALDAKSVGAKELAGEPIEAILTRAPANDAPIGGVKVITANGWFAARPSGTENIYKVYAESFKGTDHLDAINAQAAGIVAAAIR
jgi:phosphoglucomutase